MFSVFRSLNSLITKFFHLFKIEIRSLGLILSLATLPFVGWVEPISGYVGFRFTQPNLQFVSSIVQCKTQQWPIVEPSPEVFFRISHSDFPPGRRPLWPLRAGGRIPLYALRLFCPHFVIRHSTFIRPVHQTYSARSAYPHRKTCSLYKATG